jgi:cytochrome c biogenesis factor
VGGYTLTYQKLEQRQRANATEIRALLDVRRGTHEIGSIKAGKNAYSSGPSTEVGIRTNYLTGEDLYVIAEDINSDGTVQFRVFVKPLVNLIWLAGLVFLLGSVTAMWPDAREERRLALRYREAGTTLQTR